MQRFFLFFLLLGASLAAEEPIVYLSWKHDPTSTMTVQWITKKSDTKDLISYKKSDGSQWRDAKGSHQPLPASTPYVVHKVELTGLQPNSTYNFRFGNKDKVLSFKTMPKDLSSPIRFITGGDAYHSNLKRFEAMCKQAAKENPRFAIIGGDIAYAAPKKGGKENWTKWQEFFTSWYKIMRDKEGCLIPLLVTIGNHEVTGAFNRSMKEAPFYYSFFEKSMYDLSFGSYLHLTFLDSGHTQKIPGKQTDWLKKTLSKNQNHMHRFCIYHVGAYPTYHSESSAPCKNIRKHWVPLFEKYKVNGCFESHDHAYKRTHPLLNGKKNEKGVVYLGDGSWGVKPRKPKSHPYLANKANKQQALVVEISKQQRKFWAVDTRGKMIDYYDQAVKGT